MISKDGIPKILDFGLALITRPETDTVDSSAITKSMGTILGTVAYMSPEQAEGKKVGHPTDIFSFGVVMYEALTGQRPFKGETSFMVASSILRDDPVPVASFKPDIPQHLGRIVKKSLQKDPRTRYQTIREVAIDLKEVQEIVSRRVEPPAEVSRPAVDEPAGVPAPASVRPVPPRRWPVLAGAAAAAFGLGVVAAWLTLERATPRSPLPLRKFQVSASPSANPANPVVSPDGTMIAYTQGGRLWVRDLNQIEPREVPETDGAVQPFWSPQSDFVGYFDRDTATLKKIPAKGGPGAVLCRLSAPLYQGAAWGSQGRIVFSQVGPGHVGLFEVPAQDGEPRALVTADSSKGEFELRHPCFLPDGRTLLFTVFKDDGSGEIVVQSGTTRTRIFQSSEEFINSLAYSPTGHILFQRGSLSSGIWAIPFSLSNLTQTGESFRVAPNADWPSVSVDGTLVYRSGTTEGSQQLVWVDRTGTVVGTIGQPQGQITTPVLSPDGRLVAVMGTEDGSQNIWIHDVARGTKTRLTAEPAGAFFPAWSPDGRQVAFASTRSGVTDLFVQAADGSGIVQPLVSGPLGEYAPAWSPDGRYVAYYLLDPKTNRDLWYLPLTGTRKPAPFLQTPAVEALPVISPDGRYVAYMSNESRRYEVYIKPFPTGEGKWPVSVNGGVSPRWSGRGDELFYVEDNALMAVPVETRAGFRAGLPRRLFAGEQTRVLLDPVRAGSPPFLSRYDVTPDGQRFVVVQSVGEGAPLTITVVQNWAAEFKQKP